MSKDLQIHILGSAELLWGIWRLVQSQQLFHLENCLEVVEV